jgi:hypothetical protein
MATKYECDRCGRSSTSTLFLRKIVLPKVSYNGTFEGLGAFGDGDLMTVVKELCANCVNRLHEAVKPEAKPAPREPVADLSLPARQT